MNEVFDKPLAIVDIETTGASPAFNRILEIAVIKLENGKITERFNTVIDPEEYIQPTILSLTGITEQEIKKAPTFLDIHKKLEELLAGSIFVAHNVRFDYGFIKNEFKRLNVKFDAECLCTVKLSRELYPKHKRHDLSSIINRFDFTCESRHRAMPDALVLVDLITQCAKVFSAEKMAQTVEKIMKRSSLPAHVPQEIIRQLPKKSGVYIFYGEHGDKLYIGKSINIYNRVLNHFASDHTSGKEMRLSQEVHDIEAISTPGELSALLLESHLIKKEQPLYNRMSRRARKLIVLKEKETLEGYKHVDIKEVNQGSIKPDRNIIGIFRSKRQATKTLEAYQEANSLCPKLLGLEHGAGQCFYSQIGKCNGACFGNEPAHVYNSRFDQAFSDRRIKIWPWSGPVLITEGESKETGAGFIINNWMLEGSFVFENDVISEFLPTDYTFDYDSYKILSSYLLKPKRRLKVLSAREVKKFLDSITR
jgi:DNA polymerase-3 subunit epsilon